MKKMHWILFAVLMSTGCANTGTYRVDKSGVSQGVKITDSTGGDAPLPSGASLKIIKMVPPDYPEALRRAKVTGVVLVGHTVLPDGNVTAVHIVQSAGEQLDRLALAAVAKWRYEPYQSQDGKLASFAVPLTFSVK